MSATKYVIYYEVILKKKHCDLAFVVERNTYEIFQRCIENDTFKIKIRQINEAVH